MNTIVHPAPAASKALWIAVGVLGAAVVGLGAVLFNTRTQPTETAPAAPVAASVAAAGPAAVASNAPAAVAPHAPVSEGPVVKTAPVGTPHAAKALTKPVVAKTVSGPGSVPAVPASPVAADNPPVVVGGGVSQPIAQPVVQAAPRPVCAQCGIVESVTPVQREGHGSGAGAVAGGVLGAIVGNQVGQGNGKTLATIIGAVGGGLAGNKVEKTMKKETFYTVRLHMEDGSTRTLEQTTSVAVGAKVMVDGSSLRGADGAVLSHAPQTPAAKAAPAAPDAGRAGGVY
jgi:outer membrane lipoprotein SlyB